MKISSPVGEYEYHLERLTFTGGHLEVLGRLGQWQTTTILEPADLWNLLRKAAFPLMLATGLWAVTRRVRRV